MLRIINISPFFLNHAVMSLSFNLLRYEDGSTSLSITLLIITTHGYEVAEMTWINENGDVVRCTFRAVFMVLDAFHNPQACKRSFVLFQIIKKSGERNGRKNRKKRGERITIVRSLRGKMCEERKYAPILLSNPADQVQLSYLTSVWGWPKRTWYHFYPS